MNLKEIVSTFDFPYRIGVDARSSTQTYFFHLITFLLSSYWPKSLQFLLLNFIAAITNDRAINGKISDSNDDPFKHNADWDYVFVFARFSHVTNYTERV